MNKLFFVLILLLQTQFAFAQRLTMQQLEEEEKSEAPPSRVQMTDIRQDNAPQNESLKALLSRLCESASREDLDAYFSFFENPNSKNRKNTALIFAEHDVSMNLLDCHVVSTTDKEAEVVVKYTMTFSRNTTIYLSVINLKKVGNDWKIVNEKIQKQFAIDTMVNTGRVLVNNNPAPAHFPDLDEEDSAAARPQVQANCPTGNCGKNKIPMGIAQGALDFDLGAGGCATGRCPPQQNNCASGRCGVPQLPQRQNLPAVFPELEDF